MASSKKGFDKEYIFNLIMPSTPAPADEAPPCDEPSPVPEEDSLSLLQQQISRPPASPVRLPTAKELVLVNLMEQLVADRLDEVFAKFNCCRCDKCRRDVAAMALNILPPKYVVAEPDDLSRQLQECPTKDVSSALIKAILYVKNHPQH